MRLPDVILLGAFDATGQKNHYFLAALHEVHAVPGTVVDSHQSSSVMRSASMPQPCKCAPTPSDVTKGTRLARSARMVG